MLSANQEDLAGEKDEEDKEGWDPQRTGGLEAAGSKAAGRMMALREKAEESHLAASVIPVRMGEVPSPVFLHLPLSMPSHLRLTWTRFCTTVGTLPLLSPTLSPNVCSCQNPFISSGCNTLAFRTMN